MKHHFTEEERRERDERIATEIIVDAYGEEEQMLGWHVYLSQMLHFPFSARCITQRTISPLREGDRVKVVGLVPEEEYLPEMFVLIKWRKLQFGVSLTQLEGIKVDEETQQAIEDWHYWVKRGDDDDDTEIDDEMEE